MKTQPNCKINTGLHIIRKRKDGYHDIETVFIPVPLCDELEIETSEKFCFEQSGIDVCCDIENNLVVKAYRLLQKDYDNTLPNVKIHLHKRIPFGAGLGGGSSDAAFALKMLNEIFDLGINADKLKQKAAKLGADCAFFIDNKPSYSTGIGDILSPLGFNPLEGYSLFMVKPDEAISTAEAYSKIRVRESRKDITTCYLPDALKQPISKWRELIVNDFEEPIFAAHPLLSSIKEELYAQGAAYAAMSGSGATVYGVFETLDNASLTTLEEKYTCYKLAF